MNPRSAQILTASLAALLVVLVGATVFVLLTRPTVGPTPSPSRTPAATLLPPSPTTVAVISPAASAGSSISASVGPVASAAPATASAAATAALPSPTFLFTPAASSVPSATIVPTPSPTPTPIVTPSPTIAPTPTVAPTATPLATPSPSPSPSPTQITPTAPERSIRFVNVGLDQSQVEGSNQRLFTFNVDGPSMIGAHLSNASASARLCVWTEASDDQRECHTVRNGGFVKTAVTTDESTWHASLIGAGSPATVTLTIDFNANQPSVSIENFRYRGALDPDYNGFEAHISTVNDGTLHVQAAFDDGSDSGGSYSYRLTIDPSGFDETGGPVTSVDRTQAVNGSTDYAIAFHDPDDVANPTLAVFVAATITWP